MCGFIVLLGVITSTPVVDTETICIGEILKGLYKQAAGNTEKVNKSPRAGLHIETHTRAYILEVGWKKKGAVLFYLCSGARKH